MQGKDNNAYLLSLGRTKLLSKFSGRVLSKLRELYPIFSSTVKKRDKTQHLSERHSYEQPNKLLGHVG